VINAAREARVPVAVVCGRAEIRPVGVTVASLVERFGRQRAMDDSSRALEDLAEELAVTAELSSRA
jgi:hypothetical protein